MSEMKIDETVEQVENTALALIDNILNMENEDLIDREAADECFYHLHKLANLLGLELDLDSYNDDYLNEKDSINDDEEVSDP